MNGRFESANLGSLNVDIVNDSVPTVAGKHKGFETFNSLVLTVVLVGRVLIPRGKLGAHQRGGITTVFVVVVTPVAGVNGRVPCQQ